MGIFNNSWINILIAAIIGLLTGLFSIVFRYLIKFLGEGYSTTAHNLFGFLPFGIWKIFVPAIAGAVVGLLIHYLAKEAKGTGIPEVMEAVALKDGIIRKRVIFVKSLAAASSIGAGASVGKEGPIVQIGSAIGSFIGQFFKLNSSKIKTCVACGAAAGIAATFNAPLAGVIFAQEVILGEFVSTAFISIVISAVASSVMSQIFLGNVPAFAVQAYTLNNPIELLFYILLGIMAALIGIFFVRTIYKTEDIFSRLNITHEWLKPMIGGLLIGVIGINFPQVLGVGYETIEAVFRQDIIIELLLVLILVKILATGITLGSGHSGGVFAPSLFIGAVFGGAYGLILSQIFPGIVLSPEAYAIVGMGAVVAGTTQAPIAAVLIIFEMTRDYKIVLPLMVAVVFSTLIFAFFSKGESVYTLKLLRRGVNLKSGKDINIMKQIIVEQVMSSPVEVCLEENRVERVIQMMHNSKHNGFPVLNKEGELVGIITLKDIREAPVEGIMDALVSNLMSRKLVITYPNETLDDVFRKLSKYNLGHLPVVSIYNYKQIVGIVTRSDIIKAYDKKLLVSQERVTSAT